MTKNIEQSVKDRLKNLARSSGRDYNFVCIQYMHERFLARLEQSDYKERFILKGALLLLVYDVSRVRPTKDIDFLGNHLSNQADDIETAIRQIAEIDIADGVQFHGDKIEIDEITKDTDYAGLRVRLSALVGGDHQRLQIDIGFGDVIVHGPVEMSYPAMLDFEPPKVNAYSLESAIAEKLQAIVSHGIFGSRMKDFYDIWFLTKTREFDRERLTEAIETTFKKRQTVIGDIKLIFEDEFVQDSNKSKQWAAFLRRISIEE
ncbi:MAG: nucleotidyl transferase AbiEii/AbiGii toxin family protein [Cyclonatronaceae bacterium]